MAENFTPRPARTARLFVRCMPEEVAYLDREAKAMGVSRAQAVRIMLGRAAAAASTAPRSEDGDEAEGAR